MSKMAELEYEQRMAADQPPTERMAFNEWWNYGEVSGNNPYRHESAAYWAWEGWQAGVKAEREARARLDESPIHRHEIAEKIRARGEK